jgi:phospholipid/cholesterol/gamma-HCH transport system substrate-binding protein
METRASYLLVGAFALIAMVAFAIAIVWMAGANLDQSTARYTIYFKGSVSGLKTGNAVQYRGIPVGVVSALEINPRNVEQVKATIEVNQRTPVKTDTVAGLGYQGITGVAYIELSGGTHNAPTLKAGSGEKYPVIKSKPSQLQELFDAAPELVNRVTHLVNLAVMFLGPKNQENVAGILENVRTITGAIAGKSDEIGVVIDDMRVAVNDVQTVAVEANATLKEISALASSVRQLSETLNKEVTGVGPVATNAMDEVRKAATEFRRASAVLSDLIERNKGPVDAFASSGLYEFTQLLAEARVLINALTRISGQIEQDPARFLFGKSQPSLEVK